MNHVKLSTMEQSRQLAAEIGISLSAARGRLRRHGRQVVKLLLDADPSQTCAICSIGGKLHVDHDHATGKIRGLLCRGCNMGLGNFRDSTVYLNRAIEYLKNPPASLLSLACQPGQAAKKSISSMTKTPASSDGR